MNTKQYQKYILGTKQILDKSQKEKTPYFTTICDQKFVVYKNVFSPKYFFDTEIFAKNLPIQNGDKILEIGPGTGAISIIAVYRGAQHVVCVDINKKAVQNTRKNIQIHSFEDKIDIRYGNLYEPLRKNEKFDVIFWNTPFGFVEKKQLSSLEKSVFDPNYQSTKIFIQEAKNYFNENGRIYIGFSTTLGDIHLIQKIAHSSGYILKCIYEENSSEIYPVKFEIFELIRKKP
jgi:methylase of polypeptide subunit release factors